MPLERRIEAARARRNDAIRQTHAAVRAHRRARRRTAAGARSRSDDRGARRAASHRAAPGAAGNALRPRRSPTSLRIRVYPDDLNTIEHVPALTPEESEKGRAYWTARFAHDDDGGGASASRLDGSLRPGPRRHDRPRPDARSTRSRPKASRRDPTFPETETIDARAKATRAVLLPDRWCAIGYAAPRREVFRIWGNRVPDELLLSPDWLATDNPETLLGGDRAWMIDFDAATHQRHGAADHAAGVERTGAAAARRPLQSRHRHLERLIVVGIEWTKTAEESAADLTDLLAAHRDSTGLGVRRAGDADQQHREPGLRLQPV